MSLLDEISEFKNILNNDIKEQYSNISIEELASLILNTEEYISVEKEINSFMLNTRLKKIDDSFKRIDTKYFKMEHNELRKTLKDLFREYA